MVLDLLKPHRPSMLIFAQEVADLEGVDGVNATLVEIDEMVQNVKLTIQGHGIDFDEVLEVLEDLGGSVHSVDEVVCGEVLVEESRTPQD